MEQIARQIYNQILKANNILLVPHQNPDGDALGAASSFSHFLTRENKPHTIFCSTETPIKYQNLPYLAKPSNDAKLWTDEKYDIIIIFDSSDLKYAGVDIHLKNISPKPMIINIDHHPTNENFGQYNLVVTKASSTTEIIYNFFKINQMAIDKKMAMSILLGLITDTENFSNPGTTIGSLKAASELIYRGANFNQLKNLLIKNKTIPSLKLWGLALSRLSKNEEFDIVYTYITQKDLTENQANDNEVEGIANFLNNLGEGKASLILKELSDGKTKGSFRTTRDDFDVAALAKTLDGGGHKKAAGFIVDGSIDNVLNSIWEMLKKN